MHIVIKTLRKYLRIIVENLEILERIIYVNLKA